MIETAVVLEKPTEYRSKSKPPDYDGLWKKVIEQLFEEFMLFFAPDLYEEINFSRGSNALQQELYPEFIQKKEGRKGTC